MWENGTDEPICRVGIETRRREWTCGHRGDGEGGTNWESSVDTYSVPWKRGS